MLAGLVNAKKTLTEISQSKSMRIQLKSANYIIKNYIHSFKVHSDDKIFT